MSKQERWWWLDVGGRRLEAASVRDADQDVVRLRVDGEVVDERPVSWRKQVLEHDGLRVEVEPLTRRRPYAVRLLPRDGADEDEKPERFRSPVGTVGARLDAYADAHPWFVVVRHLLGAGFGVILPLLGIGVLLRALLPRFDLSLSVPDWVPSIDLSWVPDPLGWLWRLLPDWQLPDLDAPGWLEALGDSWTWWGPFLIALFVALGEVDRRRKRRERDADNAAAGAGDSADTAADTAADADADAGADAGPGSDEEAEHPPPPVTRPPSGANRPASGADPGSSQRNDPECAPLGELEGAAAAEARPSRSRATGGSCSGRRGRRRAGTR